MKVVIPCSGTGSRLGIFTEHINKALLKVEGQPSITHIINNYPVDTEFVILLGYKGQHIRDYIAIAHPRLRITFVEVDMYEGPISGQLYSLNCAREHLQCPFIVHYNDTIVKKVSAPVCNFLMYGEVTTPAPYLMLSDDDGFLTKLHPKLSMESNKAFIGITGVFNYKEFWETIDQFLGANVYTSYDAHVLEELLKTDTPVFCLPNKTWKDVGSLSVYTPEENDGKYIRYHLADLVYPKFVEFFEDLDRLKERVSELTSVTVIGHFISYDYNTNV
jgi:CTP:phosphocholine cytidylyltransferase-like protein